MANNEEVIHSLKKQRRIYFNKLRIIYEMAKNSQIDSKGIPDFKSRYLDLPNLIQNFEGLHTQVVGLVPDELFDEEDLVQTHFDEMIAAVRTTYRDLCENEPQVIMKSENTVYKQTRIKLPRLEIGKFCGDLRKWPTFYDLYNTLIHSNPELSNIEKFQFLASYLEKDASSVLKNLPITDANYSIAYAALVSRYQNDRILLNSYWSALYDAPKVKHESPTELRNLLSVFSENLAALNQFPQQDMWDFTKFNFLIQKLSNSLRTRFELEYCKNVVPTYSDLSKFVENNCRALENAGLVSNLRPNIQRDTSVTSTKPSKKCFKTTSVVPVVSDKSNDCPCCKQGEHSLIKCDTFLQMNADNRSAFIKQERRCFNCFAVSHNLKNCTSQNNCRVCSKRHHTLLHFPERKEEKNVVKTPDEPSTTSTSVSMCTAVSPLKLQKCVLFATASVSVLDTQGTPHKCRVLFDSASQSSFISERFATNLGFSGSNSHIPIEGINGMTTFTSSGTISCTITPYQKCSPSFNIRAVVIPQICDKVPLVPSEVRKWNYLRKLNLAETEFGKTHKVDMLLGADVFADILRPGLVKAQNGGPLALNSVFGWILMGNIQTSIPTYSEVVSLCTSTPSLDDTMKKFWEVECVPRSNVLSESDARCESLFKNTHSRTEEGRYKVQLPFSSFPPNLGRSLDMATNRFFALESRLLKNPNLRDAYTAFMQDYLEQGHMSWIGDPSNDIGTFIPHHAVVKTDSSSKLRVVFDASAKTSNGSALNDFLLVGPKLQRDIASILLSIRIYPFIFTTDIRQMYRQILVHEDHRKFQKILWRFSSTEPVQEYSLNTVTYGVASSPYLAIRTLQQLAEDEGSQFPSAVKVLVNSCYVDDVIGVANSCDELLEIQRQLIALLAAGGFELRKWASNCRKVLDQVADSHQQPISFDDKESPGIKVLGLQWSPLSDCFSYCVQPIERSCTKRNILSEIAKIYDPLGFLAPVVLFAKHLIQLLWLQGIGWDDSPPVTIVDQWSLYSSQLPILSTLRTPRYVLLADNRITELHGFCDSSEIAYAAVIYLRQVSSNDNVSVSLMCAKTRVAPLKMLSIPRLELLAAGLLSELMTFVIDTLKGTKIDRIMAWSDSKVVLAWIKSSPHRWKTFVANRVTLIHDKIPPSRWFHVSGRQNPADCASRGLLPNQLLSHPLWWAGPNWLNTPNWIEDKSFIIEASDIATVEERNLVCVVQVENHNSLLELLNNFSSLSKILRIVAYCRRFWNNCQSSPGERVKGNLSHAELYEAQVLLVKLVQQSVFSNDRHTLRKGDYCSKPLRKLACFLDKDDVIRVGGRLRNSDLEFHYKHPMLLPRDHRLTELIIERAHKENCHPGPRALQYLLVQQFWILSVRRAIQHVLSRCVRCFRTKPILVTPFMGDLPSVRVSQIKPFSHAGVDFMGPVRMTLGKRRGICSQKAYICVFVCLATKALHLEVVSDLSTDAFLASLRRFIGRRGRCSDLYSDQGTNFVGAKRLLASYCDTAANSCQIKWHLNPPSAPHFGGLWEAGVKSVKTHLYRVIGDQVLTYEELSTVLIQIEALLNSRPLCSMSPDPNDLTSLTPGHFLTLEPLTSPPEPNLLDCKHVTRWQLLQKLHQHFWRRWQAEYLHTLQQRNKWNVRSHSPSVGDLVLIKDEHTAPLCWPLARISKLYPSSDRVPRVAQVHTLKGFLDRPLAKLCPLPPP